MSKTPGVRLPLSRRGFLKGVGAAAVVVEGGILRAADNASQLPQDLGNGPITGEVKINLLINGKDRAVTVEPRTTLLSALRDRLDPPVTGPKLVCDAGACGACTVLIEGKPACACNILAIDAIGKKITTVEGLGTPEHMSPLQSAFVEHDAMMCGFCTPGFVTSVSALLVKNPTPTLEQVRQATHGNFCRCGTYPRVFEAALAVKK